MYLAIIILPLLGSIVAGFFGRKTGVSGAQIVTCTAVVTTTVLAVLAFFEVGLNNIPVTIEVFRWIDSESLNVSWAFHFDSLTVSMLIPVLIVSSLVHIYSIGYMSHDPHVQRFFSYLSLFTFMMVILVTANNYLLMFVGPFSAVYKFKLINYYPTICWEVLTFCLKIISRKPYFYNLRDPQRLNVGYSTMYIKNVYRGKVIVQGLFKNYYSYLLHLLTIYTHYSYYNFYLYIYYLNVKVYNLSVFKRFYSKILETSKFSKQYKKEYELTQEQKESIIGIMLADGFLEKGKPTHNARLRIDHTYPEQESYVLSIYSVFSSLINIKPVINVRKADPRTNKIYKSISVKTLSFSCLNKYHDLFYRDKKKVIPLNIQDLLTPRGLAHLIMGDGFFYQGTVILCTESFTREEQELLIIALYSKFGIKASLNKRISSTGVNNFRIRISKKDMDKLVTLVKPFFIAEMFYKLGV